MNPASLLGRSFYGCKIERMVGRGAKGVVYQAHQTSLDRPIAIKLLLSSSGEGVRMLMEEARALAKINHPNVLKVYEVGVAEGTPFILMELLEGETLQARLGRAGKLPIEAILKLSAEIATGLGAAHRAKIVHRDLKPSNVFLRPSAPLKLIDFGLAYLGAVNERVTGGTPEYMAPEQWKFAAVDGRTDLYALGIMIYQMLTGKMPFKGRSLDEYMKAHVEQPLPVGLTRTPAIARLMAVVQQLTRKNPAERYPTAEEAREDIERLRSGQAPRAAARFGAPLVCPMCDSRNAAHATRCATCDHDFMAADVRMEDLLPDEPPPPQKMNFPKGVRNVKRRLR